MAKKLDPSEIVSFKKLLLVNLTEIDTVIKRPCRLSQGFKIASNRVHLIESRRLFRLRPINLPAPRGGVLQHEFWVDLIAVSCGEFDPKRIKAT
jgi:hypothetical protein